jgi:tetratricopeptide (TPR) repeat protein
MLQVRIFTFQTSGQALRMDLLHSARPSKYSRLLLAAAWASVTFLVGAMYWPGLDGPFLLDDFGSIAALGDFGGVVDWASFKTFVFGGHAGPTGRPVSLLSFLIDANNWPAESWPFKRTNLVIHIVTGLALGTLVFQVLKCVQVARRDAHWIALLSTAIWLLHPFLVSTTLYIVQRMAQLAALFMFAGLALYLHGRLQLGANARKAYITMTAAICVFTLLAMLSKENGILLPLLVGVLELTVIASQRDRLPALNRYWSLLFIVGPSAVIFLYLGRIVLVSDIFEIAPGRDFSLYERFLTQGRVLGDYLQHWFLPKLYTSGVFQDHFIKSTGWFAPVTTLSAYLLHAAAVTFALIKRRQLPLLALAILFFYAGHLLESTVVNLELYFEHRNYVAAAFLFVPIVEFVYRKTNASGFLFAGLAVVGLLSSFTYYSATVWRTLPSMIESSALKAPTSARAQGQYAKLLFVSGRVDDALEVVDQAIRNVPTDDPLLLTTKLYILCTINTLSMEEFTELSTRLSRLPFDSRALKAYNVMAQEFVTGKCPDIGGKRLEGVFIRMLEVPVNGDPTSLRYSHVNWLIGYTRVHLGERQAALDAFQRSLDARQGPSHAMAMAALMAAHGFNGEALLLANRGLVKLRQERAGSAKFAPKVNETDILAFIETVEKDLAAEQAGDTYGPAE